MESQDLGKPLSGLEWESRSMEFFHAFRRHAFPRLRWIVSLVGTMTFLAAGLFAADLAADDILKMSMDSQTRQEELQRQYVWHEHVELGPSNKDATGRTKLNFQRDFEVAYESGTVYRKLVSENAVALDPKEAERKRSMHGEPSSHFRRSLRKRRAN